MAYAIDVGHGYTKALSAHGGRVLFPSLICPPPPSVDLGEFGQAEEITIDGQPFWVGDAARGHAPPRWTRNKATDAETLRLIQVAAARLGAVGPVNLATGLPLSWFGAQRKAFRDALRGRVSVIQLPGQSPQRFWFSSVTILPQGLAAALARIVRPDQGAGDYLVADIGYRTTDYVVVHKTASRSVQADPTQAGSLEIGTHSVAATLASALEHDLHIPFTPTEVESASQVFANGEPVTLGDRRRAAAATVSRQLQDRLTEALDTTLPKLAGVVLCGGGAALFGAAFPQAAIPPDPQWANATAYLGALKDDDPALHIPHSG
ncbi:MAG: hypothetical protein C7B43_21015 [Sulfobacillus benefaciens]|uniref:Uncharacterized protein n=1 Tax=Sulfobacillus benefaciens TaxID=453960 RepID=A0A2T2WI68_9FIRM|nr:MAG: hypothetical protein C7B43_21015 [Sulfobacillus benefaciens]